MMQVLVHSCVQKVRENNIMREILPLDYWRAKQDKINMANCSQCIRARLTAN